ncbi:hypothetical protein [Chryseobacterium gambrini]|uniref:hypothetical protein n=1 Tax=Chryseobacterium gambrini TaxID=373672 RepID=UPI003D0A5AB3
MKTYVLNFILLGILLLLFCCKEDQFLKKHDVILVTKTFSDGQEVLINEAIKFEKKHKIKFEEANKIYLNFISHFEKIDSKIHYNFYPSLIIDDYYVYSFQNLKTGKIAAFGIGVNANTGEPKNFTEEIWLSEKEILKKTK